MGSTTMDSDVVTVQVMLDGAYIASLNVPEFNCDRGNKDHLKNHILCSALCAPRQLADDGTVSAINAHNNLCQVSRNSLDFYTVGRLATQCDRAEAERMDKNLERVFQLPTFKGMFEMDSRAKFKLVPPEHLKPLYNRIVRSGQWLRRKEGDEKAKKDRECNTPEAVYKAKVACNFLLELIEGERMQEKRHLVEWQSVQTRYQEMFANKNGKNRRLIDFYSEKFGLEFGQPNINSELIKCWTGRSSIKKALSLPVFDKIYWQTEENTGVLRVGFLENTSLYSDEELMKAAETIKAAAEHTKLKNEGFSRERVNTSSLQQRQTTSPQQQIINVKEPQYIPSSDFIDSESADTYSDSEPPSVGEFTDDEDTENNPPAGASKKDTPPSIFSQNAQQSSFTKDLYAKNSVKPIANPWERCEEPKPAVQAVVPQEEKKFSAEEHDVTASYSPLLPLSEHLPRHTSAFALCKGSKFPNKEKLVTAVRKTELSTGSGIELQMPLPVSNNLQKNTRSNGEVQSELIQVGDIGESVSKRREHPSSVIQAQLPDMKLPHISCVENSGQLTPSKQIDRRVVSGGGNQQPTSSSHHLSDIRCFRQSGCQSVPPKGESPSQGSVFSRRIDKSFFRPRSEVRVEKNTKNLVSILSTEESRRGSCNTLVNSEERHCDNLSIDGLSRKNGVCISSDYHNEGSSLQKINASGKLCGSQSSDIISRRLSKVDALDSFRDRPHQSSRHDKNSDHGSDRDRRSSIPSLTADQESRLRMIREYTFLYRNVEDLGFHCLHNVMDILPPDSSVDWIKLIRDRLPEVEVFPFRDKHILLWKAGMESNEVNRGQ